MPKVKPEDVHELIEWWDEGRSIFTVEMGGMGPGYERALQTAAFELIRAKKGEGEPPDVEEANEQDWGSEELHEISREHELHLSGAQFGAARNMAYKYLKHGYRHMLEQAPRDRLIQITKADQRGQKV